MWQGRLQTHPPLARWIRKKSTFSDPLLAPQQKKNSASFSDHAPEQEKKTLPNKKGVLEMTVIFRTVPQPLRKKNSVKTLPAENDRHFQKGVSAAEKKNLHISPQLKMTVIFRITSQRPRKKNLCYFKWISAIFLAKSCFGAEILMLKMTVIFRSASQPPRKKILQKSLQLKMTVIFRITSQRPRNTNSLLFQVDFVVKDFPLQP